MTQSIKEAIIVSPDAKDRFPLTNVQRADIQRVDIADVDLIVTTKSGAHYLLPGVALAAMGEKPPVIDFANGAITADQLMGEVGAVLNLDVEVPMPSSLKLNGAQEGGEAKDNAHVQQTQQSPQEQQEQKDQQEAKQTHDAQVSTLTENTEKSVEQMISNIKEIDENLHKSDYDYIPPHHFETPPSPMAAPPGVTPPISLTPIVNLFMGNVVGTTTVAGSGVTYIYGGGGQINTDASVQIGPRDPLQFSAATITGTSGNDIIYADGPLVGNTNPSADRSLNAKEFLLNVAGYFTKLNDIVISGVPAGVTIGGGATLNGDGTWTLPSTMVTDGLPFTLIYDMDAWRSSGSNTFDLSFVVSGSTARHATFSETQSFRFQYMDVTDASQITPPILIYDSHGITKQIYILSTDANQSIITSGDGNDIVYGDRNKDIITSGNGNNQIYAGAGDDTVVTGNGTNTVDLGAGNNSLTAGSGANTVTAGDGTNAITVGDGGNNITSGNGTNTIISGVGADIITVGNGANVITDSGGNNTIAMGTGLNIVTTGSGNDALTAAGGGGTFSLGAGNNSVTVNSTSGSANLYTITTTGAGTTSVTGGDNNYIISASSGIDTISIGNGNSTITTGSSADSITVGNGTMVIAAGAGNNAIMTGTGTVTITADSGNDTIHSSATAGSIAAGDGTNNITITSGSLTITTGSGADTLVAGDGNSIISLGDGLNNVTVGNGNNSITTGAGNDTVVAGNGNNSFTLGLGTNSLTAGSGTNTLNLSDITTTSLTASLVSHTVTGTGVSDTFSGISNITGNDIGNVIAGNSSANILTGGAGNDTITGGGGNDTIYGLGGNDTITGGTGNDTLYGGNGNNTLYTGTAGTDLLYGGTGNNTFISQHVGGVSYDGTNGGVLTTGTNNLVYTYTNGTVFNFYLNAQINEVDYSSNTVGMNINLSTGIGSGGDTYAMTPTSGVSSINAIIAGSGNDNITGSNGDDFINGGVGNDVLSGGLGTNILVGGAGTNNYYIGPGTDTFISSTAGFDQLSFGGGLAANVINLDSVSHTFNKSMFGGYTGSVTVAAYMGSNKGLTAGDAFAYSTGDYFAPVSGVNTDFETYTAGAYGDVLYGGVQGMTFYSNSGSDYFFGGSGSDTYTYNSFGGNDHFDGGAGTDVVAYPNVGGNVFAYLDGTADTNANGVADYIDRGLGSLTDGGIAYTGFVKYTVATGTTFLIRVENISTAGGNDTLVGDANNNVLDASTGSNAIYGLGGNDTIYDYTGSNTIDGGLGTDLVSYVSTTNTAGAYVFLADATFQGGASDKTSYWGSGFGAFQARTGATGSYAYSTITNAENLAGTEFADVLYGDSNANSISGNGGNDIIAGNGGADSLSGGAGNDTFLVTSANLAATTLFDGGAGTDIVKVTGLTSMTAGTISAADAKYVGIETYDVRNAATGNTYAWNANDIVALMDSGASSSVTLKLDIGDTFTPTVGASSGALSYLVASTTASDTIYWFYSDASHATLNTTNRVAIIDVYKGVG